MQQARTETTRLQTFPNTSSPYNCHLPLKVSVLPQFVAWLCEDWNLEASLLALEKKIITVHLTTHHHDNVRFCLKKILCMFAYLDIFVELKTISVI